MLTGGAFSRTDDGRDGRRQPSGANQRPAYPCSSRHSSTSALSGDVYHSNRTSGTNEDTRSRRCIGHTGVAGHIDAFWTVSTR